MDKNSPESIDELLRNAYDTRVYNLARSIRLGKKALRYCTKFNFDELAGKAHNLLGLFYMIKGAYKQSIINSKKGLHYFERENISEV